MITEYTESTDRVDYINHHVLMCYNPIEKTKTYLYAQLDSNTFDNLPIIIENDLHGIFTLSDGSVWKENYWFFCDSSHWKKGDRIFVEKWFPFRLLNVDYNGFFFNRWEIHPYLLEVL
jgi:hypothetical protein